MASEIVLNPHDPIRPAALKAERSVVGDEQRRLVRHGGLYTAIRVIAQGAPYALLPVYAHWVGDAGYGLLELLGVVGTFLGLLFLQGQNGAWARLRFDFSDPPSRRRFEATVVWYLVVSGLAGLLILWALGEPLARLVTPGVPFFPLGLLTAFAAFCSVFHRVCERGLQVDERPLAFALFSLTRVVLTVGTIVLFVVGLNRGAPGKIYADVVWSTALAVVALALLRPASPSNVSRDALAHSLRYGIPLIPHSLAAMLNDVIDRVLLNGMLGLGVVGVYSMGYRVGAVAMVVATALNQAFAPIFIRTMKIADAADDARDPSASAHRKRLAELSLLSVALIALVALAVTASAREILALFTTPAFKESWRVVAFASIGALAYACYLPSSQSILYAKGGVRFIPAVTIATGAVNVAGNLLLIPPFGMLGAAVATVLSNSCMAILAFVLGQRFAPLPFAWQRWGSLIAATVALLVALWVADAYIQEIVWRLAAKGLLLSLGVWLAPKTAGFSVGTILALARGRGPGK